MTSAIKSLLHRGITAGPVRHREASVFFIILGLIGLTLGTASALSVERFPLHRVQLEQWGGNLFVGSLALLGLGFPII
jgi:hypothetical protein